MGKIGLIAGKGNLPKIWARAAVRNGERVYALSLFPEGVQPLAEIVDEVQHINVGALDKIINFFLQNRINRVVMIGKVEKGLLFQGVKLDLRVKKILSALDELNDDAIMLGIVRELADEGIKVLPQTTYLEDLFPGPGVLTGDKVDQELETDMKYGIKMAREIGRLDIGQTVVVKNRAVLAVEAIEGTDAAILRGGELGGPGVVVAKVSKPQQDFRFDIPTVGLITLRNLIQIKARALVIEANKTFLLNRDELIHEAKEHNIIITAMD